MNINQLAGKLQKEGIISNTKAIHIIGEYKKLQPENLALGKYIIQPRTSVRTLLNGFRLNARGNGNAEVEVDVVVPNVRFIEDLAGKLAKSTMTDSASFLHLINSQEILEKYGFTKEQFNIFANWNWVFNFTEKRYNDFWNEADSLIRNE